MMNIELARIILADREREIEAALRVRRQRQTEDMAAGDERKPRRWFRSRGFRPTQRPASSGAGSR